MRSMLRGLAQGVGFGLAVGSLGCGQGTAPTDSAALRLITAFQPERVEGGVALPPAPPRTEVSFAATAPRFEAGPGIADLAVREGKLAGRVVADGAALRITLPAPPPEGDFVHAIELRLRASAGHTLRAELRGEDAFAPVLATPRDFWNTSPLVPGPELRSYRLTPTTPISSSAVRHVFLAPTDAGEASFEVESVRVILEKEHLAGIASGPGWHGLGEIYRDAIVARAPETVAFPLKLPARAWLDLALGTVGDEPVTFRVSLRQGERETRLLERTLTTPQRWEPVPVDLTAFAGEDAVLALSLASPEPGAIGMWGAPVVRSSGARADKAQLQGVILIQADTLRRDHLDAYGYARETAPVLRSLAAQGARFEDCIAQATWTKVSSPSILLSLYPSSHQIVDFTDRLPEEAVTLAEHFRDAGFATLSLSSVFFTGKLTNLQQGYDELHESTSLPDTESSKTARVYVDRLLPWLAAHREVPFFVFLHVFDPHDPYRPERPYDALFADAARNAEHEAEAQTVRKFIEVPLLRAFGMPNRAELLAAGLDAERYVAHERDWYDGSIRGMDVEIGRLVEGLVGLGLSERTLVAFTSDHGEEFLEHGRMFHGQSVYGELSRVPLILWGPGRVPAERVIEPTVQSIDIAPTLLDFAGIAAGSEMQGRSLRPLLAASEGDTSWAARPAITEKGAEEDLKSPTAVFGPATAIVSNGFKLVQRQADPKGAAKLELYDSRSDPLDQHDVAAEHPDVVKQLTQALATWRAEVARVRLAPGAPADEATSAEELERLRSLGYVE